MFAIEEGVVDNVVVSECLSPNGFDMAVFGFCQGNDVWVGLFG